MENSRCKINEIKGTKAQSTLEAAIIFVAAILLLGGITRIWLWSNSQIVQRQIRYNETRVAAGTSSLTYKLSDNWPAYAPPPLNGEQP
ncbi:MAG: hypothetical protein Q8O22_05445 [Candidatus Omnitrophota bacterium]|nr:hypothetical protein [Candidatus Omnitrophota bacterium]